MSFRRHVVWCTRAAGVLLLSTLATGFASAQCSHGGGAAMRGSAMSGGMRNPQMLQGLLTQNLVRQQQQLQLIQQQQLQLMQQQALQRKQLDDLKRELAGKSPEELKKALSDPRPEMRVMAARAVGEQSLPLTRELIELLTDDHPQVRQAARSSLVRLSKLAQKASDELKGTKRTPRGVDFGPPTEGNRVAQRIAARKWGEWYARQAAELAAVNKEPLPELAGRPTLPKLSTKAGAAAAKEKQLAKLGRRPERDPSEP